MEAMLSYGYFSLPFLTVLAAVVIGAFWVRWGLLALPGEKKDPPPGLAHSERVKKEDASAERAPFSSGKGTKVAPTEMAPASAARKEEIDALAVNLYAAPAVEGQGKVHEFPEEVGISLVAAEEDVPVERTPLAAGNRDRADGHVRAEAAEANEEGKGAPAMDLCAAPPVEGEKKIREFAKAVGVPSESGEKRVVPVEEITLAAGSLNKADGSMRPEAAEAWKGEKDATALVKGKKVQESVEEVGVALVTEEGDVPLDNNALAAENSKKADGSTTTRPKEAEEREIGELTLEELKAYDGSDTEKPLLMVIKRYVYDVSKSRKLYGPGGDYELFGGRDATRALALMSFDPEDLTGNLDGLGKADLEVLADWEQKFMEKYPIIGRLVAVKSNGTKQNLP